MKRIENLAEVSFRQLLFGSTTPFLAVLLWLFGRSPQIIIVWTLSFLVFLAPMLGLCIWVWKRNYSGCSKVLVYGISLSLAHGVFITLGLTMVGGASMAVADGVTSLLSVFMESLTMGFAYGMMWALITMAVALPLFIWVPTEFVEPVCVSLIFLLLATTFFHKSFRITPRDFTDEGIKEFANSELQTIGPNQAGSSIGFYNRRMVSVHPLCFKSECPSDSGVILILNSMPDDCSKAGGVMKQYGILSFDRILLQDLCVPQIVEKQMDEIVDNFKKSIMSDIK